jgi:hypothetical protein
MRQLILVCGQAHKQYCQQGAGCYLEYVEEALAPYIGLIFSSASTINTNEEKMIA